MKERNELTVRIGKDRIVLSLLGGDGQMKELPYSTKEPLPLIHELKLARKVDCIRIMNDEG